MSYANDKIKQRLFQQSRGCYNSKINDPIWLGFKLIWEFIHAYLICKFQEDPVKTKCWWQSQTVRLFQQPRGCNSKINDPIWPDFKLIRDFIHVHLICKFQEDLIKTEWVMLMTKSNRGLFSNQGDISLRLMIQRSCQFSNLPEIFSMSNLSASFRNIWSKLKEL